MDITAFIRELLFGHDCVIVPGFGGFIGNYTPARIDKKTGTFFPPVKQISFNRNLSHNDGLLVGKISATLGINYGDARNIVEEFVADNRRKLESGEKVIFDNIGSFVNNHEGNIQFEPDRSVNYHLDSYGLESFQLMPLEGYDVRTRVTRHINKDPERLVSLRKILWRAAVIVPLLSVLVIVPLKTNMFRSKVVTSNLNPLVSVELEQNKVAIDEAVKSDTTGAEEIIDTAVGEQPPAEVIVPAVGNANVYYLITGSFKSEENALSQVSTLKAKGFTPEIIAAPNGFYRVCAIACSSMEMALEKKDSVSVQFPGAWISGKK